MKREHLNLNDFDLKKTSIDIEEIRNFDSEDKFMVLFVEIFKEIAIVTTILTCAYTSDNEGNPQKWTRNDAILGGLMIRLSKLQNAFLDSICQKRLEIVHIIFRCISETVVNLLYLIKMNDKQLFDEYVEYSLREEKRLLNLINKNIKKRGKELNIEKRMKKSINFTFKNSGLKPEDVNENKRVPWGESIYKRAEKVRLSDIYYAFFGLPCHVVHGNWQDLFSYHLIVENDKFTPNPKWNMPRPQVITMAGVLSSRACKEYLKIILTEGDDYNFLINYIDDFEDRLFKLDLGHEKYLQKVQESNNTEKYSNMGTEK